MSLVYAPTCAVYITPANDAIIADAMRQPQMMRC